MAGSAKFDIRSARLGLRPEVWMPRDDVLAALDRLADSFRETDCAAEAVGVEAAKELLAAVGAP